MRKMFEKPLRYFYFSYKDCIFADKKSLPMKIYIIINIPAVLS